MTNQRLDHVTDLYSNLGQADETIHLAVELTLPLWPGLPAAVDPEPLVGVAADPGLNGGSAECRGIDDVSVGVGGAGQRKLGAEVQDVTAAAIALGLFPD